jgi:hypothetical protein
MAEYGEWNRKSAVLSDVTAQKEYGVNRAKEESVAWETKTPFSPHSPDDA